MINNVGEGFNLGDSMTFQNDNEITHVEAPSSAIVIPII
jgi:hypothetical protein